MLLRVYPDVCRLDAGPQVRIGKDHRLHERALRHAQGSRAHLRSTSRQNRPRGKATREIYGCDMPLP